MNPKANNSGLKWLFAAAVFAALFTGFGNMPLYGRYYIADIPGFAWSGDFIANLKVHLVAGALLIGLAVYTLAGRYILKKGQQAPRTAFGRVVDITLALAILTGLIATVRNFACMTPGLEAQMTINFTHMGAGMLFAVIGAVAFFRKG